MPSRPEGKDFPNSNTEYLARFFDAVFSLSFWRRLFRWNDFRALSHEAYNEYRALRDLAARQRQDLDQVNAHVSVLESTVDHLQAQQQFFEKERGEARATIDQLRDSVATTTREVTILREREVRREEETSAAVTSLNAIREQIASDRAAEREALETEDRERRERMKRTWQDHEHHVKEHLKLLCQRHTIEYVDVVPFRGSPDNTIALANEYIVFDAKSPASDDLRTFGTYLKSQAEAARKYVKEERVRREVFLVVPSSTLASVQQYVHHFADHTVYVVSVDALEPIILTLRRIQEYEFAEQLSPEDRESIIRIVGRFMHMTKRRIQVDQFFDRQFLNALAMTETDLQPDLLSQVQTFERTLKLNPPSDQRLKLLNREELATSQDILSRESEARGISPIDAPLREALPSKIPDEPPDTTETGKAEKEPEDQ